MQRSRLIPADFTPCPWRRCGPPGDAGGQRLSPSRGGAMPDSKSCRRPAPLPRASRSQLPLNFERLAAQLWTIRASPAGHAALTRMLVGLNTQGFDSSFSPPAVEHQRLVVFHAATPAPTRLLTLCCCLPATPVQGSESFGAEVVQSIRKITKQPPTPAQHMELELPCRSGFSFRSDPG